MWPAVKEIREKELPCPAPCRTALTQLLRRNLLSSLGQQLSLLSLLGDQ